MVLTGSGETRPDPDRCGDEPALLAEALGSVPVVVDADRYRGAVYAMKRFPVDIFLMDDGFQHLQLFRDLDIVLLPHGEDPDRLACMPRGPLREPASALLEADMLVRVGPGSRIAEGVIPPRACLGNNIPRPTEHSAVMEAGEFRAIDGSLPADSRSLAGRKVFAFCGIARPDAFWKTLQGKGLKINDRKAYPDHHRYTDRDFHTLMERMAHVPFAVTTEKDAVKLERFDWPPGKLLVLDIYPAMNDEAAFWEQLDEQLQAEPSVKNA